MCQYKRKYLLSEKAVYFCILFSLIPKPLVIAVFKRAGCLKDEKLIHLCR